MAPSCAEGGVLGVLPGLIGMIQATEAIKLILGKGRSLVGRLLLIESLEMKFREVKLEKDPSCPLCGKNPTIKGLIDYEAFCGVTDESTDVVTAKDLKKELASKAPPLLLDVREPYEWSICKIPGATQIPLGDLESRMEELDRARRIVAFCRTGARSERAVQLLAKSGFPSARNLTGGLHAWADDVDPSLPKY
jgi:adenylyltransferase/sulfurtransferase